MALSHHRSLLSLSAKTLNLSHRWIPVASLSLRDLANYRAAAANGLKSDYYSVDSLLDWFDKESLVANDTMQKLRKDYKSIFAKLFAEKQPVLVEDVEDLHDFRWEIRVKQSQFLACKGYSFDYCLKSNHENERRCVQIPITGIKYIKNCVEEDVNGLFCWFEKEAMKVKEMIEKLRKDHQMIAQKLRLANDEQDKAVLLEELKEMFSNLSEKQSKAIHAKARDAKALDHKAKAAELLPCSFVF